MVLGFITCIAARVLRGVLCRYGTIRGSVIRHVKNGIVDRPPSGVIKDTLFAVGVWGVKVATTLAADDRR